MPSALTIVFEDCDAENVCTYVTNNCFRISQPCYGAIKMLLFSLYSKQHLFEANAEEKQHLASRASEFLFDWGSLKGIEITSFKTVFQVSTPIPSSPACVKEAARTGAGDFHPGAWSRVSRGTLPSFPGQASGPVSGRHPLPSRLRAPRLSRLSLGCHRSLGSSPLVSKVTAPPLAVLTEAVQTLYSRDHVAQIPWKSSRFKYHLPLST